MCIRSTGREMNVEGINVDRLANVRIVQHWGEANTVGMLLQMGVNPFPSHSAALGRGRS